MRTRVSSLWMLAAMVVIIYWCRLADAVQQAEKEDEKLEGLGGQQGSRTMVMSRRAVELERRALQSTLLPAQLKKEGGCNTDLHMCDAKKHLECCRGRYRNVHSNALHCGGCGRSCRQGRSCVDVNNDRVNCGRCCNAYLASLSCNHSLCGYVE